MDTEPVQTNLDLEERMGSKGVTKGAGFHCKCAQDEPMWEEWLKCFIGLLNVFPSAV